MHKHITRSMQAKLAMEAAALSIVNVLAGVAFARSVRAHEPAANTLEQIRAKLAELHEQGQAIVATAEAANRDLTAEEQEELDANLAEFDRLEALAASRERLQAQAQRLSGSRGRQTQATTPGNDAGGSVAGRNSVPAEARDTGRWGFRNMGDYCQAVQRSSLKGAQVDERLIRNASASTYGTEGTGAEGGFAVPPDFRTEIVSRLGGEESLLSRCDQQTSSSNVFVVPVDETTAHQSSGGVQAYWEGEATAYTQSKPSIKQQQLRLHKLTALVPMTEELLDDAPSMGNYLMRKIPQKMNFKVNDAIVRGTGVGMPLGFLNSPALISVAKESSQPADTIDARNIFKMWSRMYSPYRSSGIWLINQDIEPQLFQMTVAIKNVAGSENVGGSVVYLPANGLSASPFGTLMGRPVVPVESASTLGDQGDIAFVSLAEYLAVQRIGGMKQQMSIHLWFDQDLIAFKVSFRLAGQPWAASTISPANGSSTKSAFVTLDERA